MVFRKTRSFCKKSYAIPEPYSGKYFPKLFIHRVCMPLLAFSESGERLGMGKGFYDRFLEGKDVQKIGIAYEWQKLDSLPSESHDVGLDAIITEKKVRRVRS